MEDDAEVKKAIDEAQEYYDVHDRRDWVKWADKVLMPCLHAQIAMEKAGAVRVEKEELEEMRCRTRGSSGSGSRQKRRWN
jgi:hypothetical protein